MRINTWWTMNMYHPKDNLLPLIFCVKVFWLLLYGLRHWGSSSEHPTGWVFGFEQFTVELRC
jgi:hypothetical protein